MDTYINANVLMHFVDRDLHFLTDNAKTHNELRRIHTSYFLCRCVRDVPARRGTAFRIYKSAPRAPSPAATTLHVDHRRAP